MQVLRIVDSLGKEREFALCLPEGGQMTLGRSESCDISLPEEMTLSRTHCYICRKRGRVVIHDCESVNGVLCNGIAVVEAEMRPGLEFVLGICRLSVEEIPGEEISSAAAEVYSPMPVADVPAIQPAVSEPPSVVSIKKRSLVAGRISPLRVMPAGAPTLREKKQFRTRRIQTAAQVNPRRKRSRRLAETKEHWVEAERLPVSHTGAALGLPVGFVLQLSVLVPHYPLRAEDSLVLTVAADEKCYIAVVQYDAEGTPSLIVPGSDRESTVVFPHLQTRFPQPAGADYELVAEPPFGPVRLVLLACTVPCDWNKAYTAALSLLGPTPAPGRIESAIVAGFTERETPPVWSSAFIDLLTRES